MKTQRSLAQTSRSCSQSYAMATTCVPECEADSRELTPSARDARRAG